MYVVLVDTSSPQVAVAAYAGPECVAIQTTRIEAGTDGWLTPALRTALQALPALDAVAVATGPGAFTGLRVGIAHALGLAFARGVPILAVPSLMLRAMGAPGHAPLLTVLDARKSRLYAQVFQTSGPIPLPCGPAGDLTPPEAAALVAPGAPVVGEGQAAMGASLAAANLQAVPGGPDIWLRLAGPLLASLPRLAPEAVAAHYVREPDARPPAGLPPVP